MLGPGNTEMKSQSLTPGIRAWQEDRLIKDLYGKWEQKCEGPDPTWQDQEDSQEGVRSSERSQVKGQGQEYDKLGDRASKGAEDQRMR